MIPEFWKKIAYAFIVFSCSTVTVLAANEVSPNESACTLSECRDQGDLVFRTIGKGESEPRDNGNSPEALAKNRRVDLDAEFNQITVQNKTESDRAELSGRFVLYLNNGGVLWATEDPVALEPTLSMNGPSRVKLENGKISGRLNFSYASNYTSFVHKFELVFYSSQDHDLLEPLHTINIPVAPMQSYSWSGEIDGKWTPKENEKLQYLIRAYGSNNAVDETYPKAMQFLSPVNFERTTVESKSAYSTKSFSQNDRASTGLVEQTRLEQGRLLSQSDLKTQNIALQGSRVRLMGQDLPVDTQLQINGINHPIDNQRKFAAEYILPIGSHPFDIRLLQNNTLVSQHELTAEVSGKYMFVIALADITASNNSITGNLEPLSKNTLYQDDLLVDGRLAFYLKGKVKGKYLITAQADTQERELSNLFDNFLDKDPQDVFRRLDPDQYYLVYGDDSNTYRDVDTQGRLYVRVDWDKSQALWGNYNTGIAASEHNQYNRSLYGAAFNWRSLKTTNLGEATTRIKSFVSEAQTAYGHNEFIGTGGSLYYLRNTDILPGSDKVIIEIRDRESSRVLNTVDLVRGVDYEVDEFQGRITLTRPLQQLSRDNLNSIVRDQAYDGNAHYLLVDYEYRPDGFEADHLAMGGRLKHWVGEHLAFGGTYIDEKRAGDDYQLKGVDLTLQAGKGTYLKVEQMESSAAQAPVFSSDNGGLSFGANNGQSNQGDFDNTGLLREGQALSLEARANLKQLGWTQSNVTAGVWSRETDAGYSVARRDLGANSTERGAEITAVISDKLNMYAKTSDSELEGQRRLQQNSIQMAYRLNGLQITTELRSVKEQFASSPEVSGALAALEFSKRLGDRLELKISGQLTLDNDQGLYDNNDRGTIGVRYKLATSTELGAEYSNGHRGESGTVNLDHSINDNHKIYAQYGFSTDQSLTDYNLFKDGLTLGHRSRITDKLSIYNENQNLKSINGSALSHTFGLDYRVNKYWNAGLSTQQGELDTSTGLVQRKVVSINAGFRDQRTNFSSKLEYRKDDGLENITQRVSTNRLSHQLNDDWRLAARFNYADTENDYDIDPTTGQIANADAKFIEGGLGFAYRPTTNDDWSVLGRYTYLYDLRALSQRESNTDQRSSVFSLDAIKRMNARWDLVGKLAHRDTEIRLGRQDGQWFDSSADLVAVQSLFMWSILGMFWAEFRHLSVNRESDRSGFLIEVDKHLGTNFKIGAGYNFTDFSDDLTKLDYEYKGWFINMVGKY